MVDPLPADAPLTPLCVTVHANPRPVVSAVANLTYCNAASAPAINFTSTVTGTTYAWTSTSNVGFGTSGSGNIPAFTASNPGTTPVTTTVTVTPTANGCPGTPISFTVTVNPTPTVVNPGNQAICNGCDGIGGSSRYIARCAEHLVDRCARSC